MEQRAADGLSPYRIFSRAEWAARREDTPMTLTQSWKVPALTLGAMLLWADVRRFVPRSSCLSSMV
jgi:type I pantothenate kinase